MEPVITISLNDLLDLRTYESCLLVPPQRKDWDNQEVQLFSWVSQNIQLPVIAYVDSIVRSAHTITYIADRDWWPPLGLDYCFLQFRVSNQAFLATPILLEEMWDLVNLSHFRMLSKEMNYLLAPQYHSFISLKE